MSGLRIKLVDQPDKIIQYWLKEKVVVICIVVFGILFNISMVLGPIYQGKLIDSMVKQESLTDTIKLVSLFLFFIGMTQVLRYFKRFYIRRFANSTSATMRLIIFNHILHRPVGELQQLNAGDLMTRAISDVELCVEGMRKFTTEIFDTGVLMLAYLITLLVYDGRITVLAVVFIPFAMFLAEKLKSLIYQYSIAYRKKSSEVTGLTYDFIENALLYRVNGVDSENRARYGKELLDLQKKAIKANILENSMQPVYNVIAMAGSLLVIYFGGNKVVSGEWSVGNFSTYITIFIAMAGKASKASKLFNSVQKSQVSWKRIKPYLTKHQTKSSTVDINHGQTLLEVSELTFGYTKESEVAIKNVNFSASQGEMIGITGPIASGKSTLGISLTGVYPYLGSILIDGKQLRDYTEFERSCMVSYLGHKPELLSDTIYNNITLGDKKDINQVLKDVCFDQDLYDMPEGLHTLVGNGGIRLSGGQQARVALARALLNKSKIIILDDPFSAVDMKTERMIIKNLKDNYKNSIIIIISHRLAIFNTIDKIILLHADQSIEYGSHEELMKKSDLYAEIYQLQKLESGEQTDF